MGTTLTPSGRSIRIPSPISLSGSESEVHTAPSAVEKRKATATKSSSRKVHEPGTGGLPESSDSDSEEEEEDNDDSEDSSADLSDEEKSEAELILESNDEFEEGAVGGFPANVTKKSKKMWPKSPQSTVSTSSRKRTDWELVDRFDFTSKKKQAMRKVRRIFEAQMFLSGCSTELDKQRL